MTAKLSAKLRREIKSLPGSEWWHDDGRETFESIALELKGHSIPDDDILSILTSAYAAVAGEFGG